MKLIIWTKSFSLANVGGPMGYCYNIYLYLKENPSDVIKMYPKEPTKQPVKGSGCKKDVPYILRLIKFARSVFSLYYKKFKLTDEDIILLNEYDYVHCHLCTDVLRYFTKQKIKAKLILTTHTPEPLIDEVSRNYNIVIPACIRNLIIKRETRAFDYCDKLMYPSPDAIEVYTNASRVYSKAFEKNKGKLFYVPTGILDNKDDIKEKHYLDDYKIPADAIKLCYIGRHNTIKGYDMLQKMAQKTWEKYPNVYFIIGGAQGDNIKPLDDSRWIELGWVDTNSLLNEIDVFVLPNKETYFDIILLEVLRSGIPVIASSTGGNKWFSDKKIDGLLLYGYDDYVAFVNSVGIMISSKVRDNLTSFKNSCRSFFVNNLTIGCFVKKYEREILKF